MGSEKVERFECWQPSMSTKDVIQKTPEYVLSTAKLACVGHILVMYGINRDAQFNSGHHAHPPALNSFGHSNYRDVVTHCDSFDVVTHCDSFDVVIEE